MRTLLLLVLLGFFPLIADDAGNLAAIRKSAVHLAGSVVQKDAKGYVVAAVKPASPLFVDSEADKTKNKKGQNKKAPQKKTAPAIPNVDTGTIFLVTPKQLAVGASVNMNVYPDGNFTYTDSGGRMATAPKYNDMALATPGKDKGKPADQSFNPGSMQDSVNSPGSHEIK